MSAHEIQTLIEQSIPNAIIEIRDLAGDNDHFAVQVTAEAFRGKTRIQQHQMVYQALGGRMGEQLHALSVVTKIPSA